MTEAVRTAWLTHAPTLAAFLAMTLMAGGIVLALDPYGVPPGVRISAEVVDPIDLPGPGTDHDGDSFADAVDQYVGNAMVRLAVEGLDMDAEDVYLLVGTQDDQTRFGAGRELEWLHVVDPDPLGLDPGSAAWRDTVLRTGSWQQALPAAGEDLVVAPDGSLAAEAPVFWFDVRDDQDGAAFRIEAWSQRGGADDLVAAWDVQVDRFSWSLAGQAAVPLGAHAAADGLLLNVTRALDLDEESRQTIAAQWAPVLHFAQGEAFFPTDGALMERFHGFSRDAPDLRTWALSFNNDRDDYRLLVADFDGDRVTDHRDVQVLWDILRTGTDADTVFAHVTRATGDRIAVQYWFTYPYNFVLGEDGSDIETLAHSGDREFVQFLFHDEAAARNGTPESVAFSQHYTGIRIDDPAGQGLLVDGRLHVYVARGSHASYPSPGDDSRLRNSFVGYGDVFDGTGATWAPDDYRLEPLGAQSWHAGYRWGPATRFHRDLGSPGRPLLEHSFHYPYADPAFWAMDLDAVSVADLASLYGGAS